MSDEDKGASGARRRISRRDCLQREHGATRLIRIARRAANLDTIIRVDAIGP